MRLSDAVCAKDAEDVEGVIPGPCGGAVLGPSLGVPNGWEGVPLTNPPKGSNTIHLEGVGMYVNVIYIYIYNNCCLYMF